MSGCTACVGLITEDKIYIVGALLIGEGSDSVPLNSPPLPHITNASSCRQMLATREAFWASRAAQSRCRLTINHKTRVRLPCRPLGHAEFLGYDESLGHAEVANDWVQ